MRITELKPSEMCNLLNEKQTYSEVARMCGVTRERARVKAKNLGIKRTATKTKKIYETVHHVNTWRYYVEKTN